MRRTDGPVRWRRTYRGPIVAAGVLMLTAALVVAGSSETAASTTSSAPALATPNCPDGTQAVMPSSSQMTAHGAAVYTYWIGGVENRAIVPPQNFDPAHASDAILQEFGYPRRPPEIDSAANNQWLTGAEAYRGTDYPSFCVGPPLSHSGGASTPTSGASADGTASYLAFTNWAGYGVRTGSFDGVDGNWTEPVRGKCYCTGQPDEVQWVGIGGYQNHRALIQDGTEMKQGEPDKAWYEYLRPCGTDSECGPSIITTQSVSAGSTIYSSVTHDWCGIDCTHFIVTENGQDRVNVEASLGPDYYDGYSAEWINERPTYSSPPTYHPLTNWGTMDWYSARAHRSGESSWHQAAAFVPRDVIEMTDNGVYYDNPSCGTQSHVLAYGYGMNGGSFSATWCRAE
jgi:hypothetical protein